MIASASAALSLQNPNVRYVGLSLALVTSAQEAMIAIQSQSFAIPGGARGRTFLLVASVCFITTTLCFANVTRFSSVYCMVTPQRKVIHDRIIHWSLNASVSSPDNAASEERR